MKRLKEDDFEARIAFFERSIIGTEVFGRVLGVAVSRDRLYGGLSRAVRRAEHSRHPFGY
jgi:hypothetical protein